MADKPPAGLVSYGGPAQKCEGCQKWKSWHICESWEGYIICQTCAWEAKHGRLPLEPKEPPPPAPEELLQGVTERFELLTLLGLPKDRLLASF